MPHYWDNKALPTPTLTDIFFQLWLFPSFLLKINAFRCDMIFEKGEKSLAKGRFELGSIASRSTRFSIYTTETDVKWVSFFSVDCLNHTLVGGVSVNSLCQQGRLFALSVNRHSVFLNGHFCSYSIYQQEPLSNLVLWGQSMSSSCEMHLTT